MIDALNYLHEQEYKGLVKAFMIEKARKLEIEYTEQEGEIVPKYPDGRNEALLRLRDEEIKLIKRTC